MASGVCVWVVLILMPFFSFFFAYSSWWILKFVLLYLRKFPDVAQNVYWMVVRSRRVVEWREEKGAKNNLQVGKAGLCLVFIIQWQLSFFLSPLSSTSKQSRPRRRNEEHFCASMIHERAAINNWENFMMNLWKLSGWDFPDEARWFFTCKLIIERANSFVRRVRKEVRSRKCLEMEHSDAFCCWLGQQAAFELLNTISLPTTSPRGHLA